MELSWFTPVASRKVNFVPYTFVTQGLRSSSVAFKLPHIQLSWGTQIMAFCWYKQQSCKELKH